MKPIFWAILTLNLVLLSACATSPQQAQTAAVDDPDRRSDGLYRDRSTASPLSAASADQAGLSAPGADAAGALQDYRLGPQDLVEISVFGVEELSREVRLNARGFISLPLVGLIDAKGLTDEELAQRIAAKLAEDYLQDPHVSVFVKEYASQRVTIEGAVERPGIYVLSSTTSLLQGIALAQGLAKYADPKDVRLFRADNGKKRVMVQYDLNKIRAGEQVDPTLQGDDVIVVRKSGARTLLNDSLLRDALDLLNPFRVLN